jgi:hypothetical protein
MKSALRMSQSQGDLNLTLKLLGYIRQLGIVITDYPLDYSVVYAISKSMAQVVEACPPRFTQISDHVKKLEDIVLPSSGLGLTEIWATWSINKPRNLSEARLTRLNTDACSLRETVDIYGGLADRQGELKLTTFSGRATQGGI